MVIKKKISREKITTQQRLMARMGNGLLRQIKDSAEAERIKRETGDEDMFVFYDNGQGNAARSSSGNEEFKTIAEFVPEPPPQPIPNQGGPLPRPPEFQNMPALPNVHSGEPVRPQLLSFSDNSLISGLSQAAASTPASGAGSPSGQPGSNAGPSQQGQTSKAQSPTGKATGPLTGHAAASLNPDGSTRIRRLDRGTDPGVEVNKGGKFTGPGSTLPSWLGSLPKKGDKAPTQRNSPQDTREMETETERMLEPSVAAKILHGLAETARKAPAGIAEALSDTKDALTSEEMKKGMEFGVRAALEVIKETGKRVGKDALWALVGANLPLSLNQNIAVTTSLLTNQGIEDYQGEFESMGKRIGNDIESIKQNVWGKKQ